MVKVNILKYAGEYSNSYVVCKDNECIIIDPSHKLRLTKIMVGTRKVLGIFLTHGHYDHFVNIIELQKEFNCKVYMHGRAYTKLCDPKQSCAALFGYLQPTILNDNDMDYVLDNQIIKLGSMEIKVIYTPGHTNCSVSYIIEDNIFTGDTLFKDSVGRTDLPSGSQERLFESIRRLINLDFDGMCYPGHEEEATFKDALYQNKYLQNYFFDK